MPSGYKKDGSFAGKVYQNGHLPWTKGQPRSNETKRKIRDKLKGRKLSKETKIKMGNSRRGEKNPAFRGGRIKCEGYILILNPTHPYCTKSSYVRQSRLVIEKQIGRYLKPKETGHHLGKRDDNRPKMLMAFSTNGWHLKFHAGKHIPTSKIIFDGRKLKRRSKNEV